MSDPRDLLDIDLAGAARREVADVRRAQTQGDLSIGLLMVWGGALAGLAFAELMQALAG